MIPATGIVSRYRENDTIRQAYAKFPYNLAESPLANPLSVHVVVISKNLNQTPQDQVLVRRRSNKVALYRGFYQSSAAGYMNLVAHVDDNGKPNLFLTAIEEAQEEIADKLDLQPSDFKLIGICANWEDLDLNAYGFVETGLSAAELIGDHKRDTSEGPLESLPFSPSHVLEHIAKHPWEPVGAMAMCAALSAHFDRAQVDAAAQRVPAKAWRDFTEQR